MNTIDEHTNSFLNRGNFVSAVGQKAAATIADFTASTKIHNGIDDPPKFSWSELQMGKLLGQGGFNTVYEVYVPSPTKRGAKLSDVDGPYAIKSLKHSTMCHKQSFVTGATDLVYEAKLLSVLNHENIIKVLGLPRTSVAESYCGGGYFIILEKLVGTVEDKLESWRKGISSCSSLSSDSGSRIQHSAQSKDDSRNTRLNDIAIPVAEAMQYLHSKNVIFRDLKPSNVGFDQHGIVKLFDFGLAREITNPTRLMTGCTGSRRYMAPEVAMNQFYGLPADVYSFGVMLYEIVSLTKPFADMSRTDHFDAVIRGRFRPYVSSDCGSATIQKLMKSSWDRWPEHRPNFESIVITLMEEKIERDARECNSGRGRSNWYKRGLVGLLCGSPVKQQTTQRGACVV